MYAIYIAKCIYTWKSCTQSRSALYVTSLSPADCRH